MGYEDRGGSTERRTGDVSTSRKWVWTALIHGDRVLRRVEG